MKKLFLTYIIVLMFCCLSCKQSISVPENIKLVLERAGNNRGELEKVIRYYSADIKDSLKLKATFFLIENIDGLKTLDTTYKEKNIYFDSLNRKWLKDSKKHNLSGVAQLIDSINYTGIVVPETFQVNYVDELKTVSAKFLIENIESAFYVWRTMGWSKNITYDVFCEYILPYRCTNTYSTNTRKHFLDTFKAINDSLKNPTTKAVSGKIIKDIDNWFTEDGAIFVRYPYLAPISFNNLFKGKIGACVDANSLKVMALRSLGIPAVLDNIPNWGNLNSSHSWFKIIGETTDSVLTNENIRRNTQHIISGSSYKLYPNHDGIPKNIQLYYGRTVPKVFRWCFAKQKESLESIRGKKDEIPTYFKNDRLKDVSAEYLKCADVKLSLNKNLQQNSKFLYLCVFDNKAWQPVAWTKIEKRSARFKDMGLNIVYLPAYFINNQIVPADNPFILNKNGDVEKILCTKEKEHVRLFNKYPYRTFVDNWQRYMIGGRFQLANKEDLSDTVTIKKIEKLPFYETEIKINLVKKFQYVIFQFNNLPQVFISEIELWGIDENNKEVKLKGKLIGNPGKYPRTSDQIADGNRSSYFAGQENSSSYIGFDLGDKKVRVSKIRYIPRNDDNCVVRNVNFELFYWKDKWVSLGIKKGNTDKTVLFKNVPKNALLLLKNTEGGSENRIFTYKENKQIFW